MTGTWLTLREVHALYAEIASKVPLVPENVEGEWDKAKDGVVGVGNAEGGVGVAGGGVGEGEGGDVRGKGAAKRSGHSQAGYAQTESGAVSSGGTQHGGDAQAKGDAQHDSATMTSGAVSSGSTHAGNAQEESNAQHDSATTTSDAPTNRRWYGVLHASDMAEMGASMVAAMKAVKHRGAVDRTALSLAALTQARGWGMRCVCECGCCIYATLTQARDGGGTCNEMSLSRHNHDSSPVTLMTHPLQPCFITHLSSHPHPHHPPLLLPHTPHNPPPPPPPQVLLATGRPDLSPHPHAWASDLLTWLQRPGQCRDDITRRSAGLPSALLAVAAGEAVATRGAKPLMGMILDDVLRVRDVVGDGVREIQ